MQANEQGIGLTKQALRALIEFASPEPGDTRKYGVQFKVKRDRCFARASDGRRAVECDGESDGKCIEGEWLVRRDFLVRVQKLLTGKQIARLQFTAANLFDAAIEEDGREMSSYRSQSNAAIAQHELFNIAKMTRLPRTEKSTNCVALPAAYMAGLSLVGKAMGSDVAIECFSPKTPDDPAIYRVGDGGPVHWVVAILPWTTEETHGQKAKAKANPQQSLPLEAQQAPANTNAGEEETQTARAGVTTPNEVHEQLGKGNSGRKGGKKASKKAPAKKPRTKKAASKRARKGA